MSRSLEQLFAHFCAPALAGIKPANLVSCQRKVYARLPQLLEQYNQRLNSSGIYFEIIYSCEEYYLLLVYRKERLLQTLAERQVRDILGSYGYPDTNDLSQILSCLRQRFANKNCFPHEVGLFLGYPVADFLGYALNRGKNYLLSGHWKVYADCEQAQKLFALYDSCCRSLSQKIDSGRKIPELFGIANKN